MASATDGEVDCKQLKHLIKFFKEVRSALKEEKISYRKTVTTAAKSMIAKAPKKFKRMWDHKVFNTDKIEFKELGSNKVHTFESVIKIMLKNVKVLIEFYDMEAIKIQYEATKHQFGNQEVIISIYGDCNVGKSTLLNGIIGNRYLPTNQGSETALSLYIKFKTRNSKTKSSELDTTEEDKLCPLDDMNMSYVERPDQIHDWLKKKNADLRSGAQNFNKNVCLVLGSTEFEELASDQTQFMLMDNPGIDEFGNSQIELSMTSAKNLSSGFIFITTIDTYTTLESSRILRELYIRNKEILKQRRLTIVINKMDAALRPKFGEDNLTKTDIIRKVRLFLSSKVFCCSETDVPEESVLLVCGTWAYYSRLYIKDDSIPGLSDTVAYEMDSCMRILNLKDQEKDAIRKRDCKSQASYLQEQSNIGSLEKRLKQMASSSAQIWRFKVREDTKKHLLDVKDNLVLRKVKLEAHLTDLKRQMNPYYDILSKITVLYDTAIIQKRDVNKEEFEQSLTWSNFKEACDTDLEAPENIKTRLRKVVKAKIDSFKEEGQQKIANDTYSPDNVETDVKHLLKEIKEVLDLYLNKYAFMNLSEKFTREVMSKTAETTRLSSKLLQVLDLPDDYASDGYMSQISLPELTAPELHVGLDIPVALPRFQRIINTIRRFLRMDLKYPKSYGFHASTIVGLSHKNTDEMKDNDSATDSVKETPSPAEQLNSYEIPKSELLLESGYYADTEYYNSAVESTDHLSPVHSLADLTASNEDGNILFRTAAGHSTCLDDFSSLNKDEQEPYESEFTAYINGDVTVTTGAAPLAPKYDINSLNEDVHKPDEFPSSSSSDMSNQNDEKCSTSEALHNESQSVVDSQNTTEDNSTHMNTSTTSIDGPDTATSGTDAYDNISESERLFAQHKQRCYALWTSEHEKLKTCMEDEVNDKINLFFADVNENVIKKFCQHFFDTWILILKDFGQENDENITSCQKCFEDIIEVLEVEQKQLRDVKMHISKVDSLLRDLISKT